MKKQRKGIVGKGKTANRKRLFEAKVSKIRKQAEASTLSVTDEQLIQEDVLSKTIITKEQEEKFMRRLRAIG